MSERILGDGEYTFNATAKTITLSSKWVELSLGHIKKITNLTRKHTIYDSMQPVDSISISSGVITHTHGNGGHEDSDKLQIIVDTELPNLTDADRVLFETTSINPTDVIASNGFNIMGYESIMLL